MKLRQKRFLRIVAVVLGVLALTVGVCDYFCVDLFSGAFIPVTATYHYGHVLGWLHGSGYPTDSDVLEFFPKSIPDHASNTRMFLLQ